MRFLISEFNELWAFRYIREAIQEYQAAERDGCDAEVRSHLVTSVKRAQLSMYHALGSLGYVDLVVFSSPRNVSDIKDLKIQFIVSVALVAEQLADGSSTLNRGQLLRMAKEIISGASSMLEELSGKRFADLLKGEIDWQNQ